MNIFKFTFLLVFMAFSFQSEAQVWKKAEQFLGGTKANGFTEEEAGKAIKEALVKGIEKGVDNVSQVDGYFGNDLIKIPFPEEAKKVETKLRQIGLDEKVDQAVLSMNRAAEDAAKEALPIFLDAIKGLTLRDAMNIVKGQDEGAATSFLQRETTTALSGKFKPKIETSLEKVNATKYWEDVITKYNKIPFVQKMNPDLAEYVTEKAIEGLFVMVAKEEANIRSNPGARTSDLLKKVFGN